MIKFECRNPQHPANIPRDKDMKVLEEDDHHIIVACVVCRDYYKVAAAQYITLPKGWKRVRHDLDQRNRQGSRP